MCNSVNAILHVIMISLHVKTAEFFLLRYLGQVIQNLELAQPLTPYPGNAL